MTVIRALLIVMGCMVLFAAGCCGVSLAIAYWAPDFYRLNFTGHLQEDLNVVQIAVGQGIISGAAAGMVIGLAILAAVTWYRTRVDGIMARSE